MLHATLSRPDLADPALAARWQALADAAGAPAFLSWTWIGCQAATRYDDPILIEVHDGAALVGLALFNRRRGALLSTLYLHETGRQADDAVFIEHNGAVCAPGREQEVLSATLRAARRKGGRVVLSGVDDAWLAAARAAGGIVDRVQTRLAPFARLQQDGPTHAESLSRNARAQLRRSDRSYALAGPIRVDRAATPRQALDWLAAMVVLHVAGWAARGIATTFAAAPLQTFLQGLMQRDADGMVDMLRITAGDRTIGYLLNLHANGRVLAYQSGLDYAGAGPHEKPGLTCHHAAIEHARSRGAVEYDFLAGDARYKRSLGNDVRALHWIGWQTRLSLPGAIAFARHLLGR